MCAGVILLFITEGMYKKDSADERGAGLEKIFDVVAHG